MKPFLNFPASATDLPSPAESKSLVRNEILFLIQLLLRDNQANHDANILYNHIFWDRDHVIWNCLIEIQIQSWQASHGHHFVDMQYNRGIEGEFLQCEIVFCVQCEQKDRRHRFHFVVHTGEARWSKNLVLFSSLISPWSGICFQGSGRHTTFPWRARWLLASRRWAPPTSSCSFYTAYSIQYTSHLHNCCACHSVLTKSTQKE